MSSKFKITSKKGIVFFFAYCYNLRKVTIGSGVTAAVRNRVEIGTSSHTVSITGTLTATNFTNTSDRRLKNVGAMFKAGLEEIKKLEPYHFTYKKDKGKTPRVGVMAQDLQKIFPQAVIKGDDGFLLIRMEDMFYAAINAIKEIADKIIANDKRIDELTKQNKELVTIIDQLEARLKELEK